jgi:hypothetical protein
VTDYTALKPGDFVYFVEGSIWTPCWIQKIDGDIDLDEYELAVAQPFAIAFGTDKFTLSQSPELYYSGYSGMWRFYSKKDFQKYYPYRLVILYFLNTILFPVWLGKKVLRIDWGE